MSSTTVDTGLLLDNTTDDPTRRAPLVLNHSDFSFITDTVCGVVERKTPRAWYVAFTVAVTFTGVLFAMVAYLVSTGVGVWGLEIPVAWGYAIVNFVFWVGIGHAGTLISAILFLLRQKWRTSINRFAEAMTIFAVVCAGLFPGIHVGRIWVAYWLAPVPNQMQMWPNFRSPLLWDVFAVGTYATVSLLFWYMGMIPDLATLRDRSTTRVRWFAYGLLSLGWRSSNRHWHRFEMAYLLLAALATPLVLSVHSVVSFDFAVSIVPGWHTTIFPPYFVAGAIFSGFAMVVTLVIPTRHFFHLEEIITRRHLENMSKIMLATGMMVGLAYSTEYFIAWYSGNAYEAFTFLNRAFGPYAWAYWIMVSCNVLVPQVFWFKKVRTNLVVMWFASILINVGMWFERFVIVVSSLSRDYLPTSWGYYRPTIVDVLTLAGSFGLFFSLFLLFLRFLPMIGMAEVKGVMPAALHDEPGHGDYHGDVIDLRKRRGGLEWTGALPSDVYGYLVSFDNVDDLLAGANKVRAAGYTKWDAHTPFVVHGLDAAMGVRPTRLPYVVFAGGLTGAAGGLLLQWFTNAFDYPFLISGKPIFSLPANIPVTFEMTILFAAICALLGMLVFNGLPQLYHPLHTNRTFKRATNDRFYISIQTADPIFESVGTRELLESLGGSAVEEVRE